MMNVLKQSDAFSREDLAKLASKLKGRKASIGRQGNGLVTWHNVCENARWLVIFMDLLLYSTLSDRL
jgi:hypothetical protein